MRKVVHGEFRVGRDVGSGVDRYTVAVLNSDTSVGAVANATVVYEASDGSIELAVNNKTWLKLKSVKGGGGRTFG